MISHEPEFYQDVATETWNCEFDYKSTVNSTFYLFEATFLRPVIFALFILLKKIRFFYNLFRNAKCKCNLATR